MAHQISQRRILASPTPMDPATAKTHRRRRQPPPPIIHPQPDPTVTPHSSTIHNISQRFSKLYSNHKKLVSRPHHPHPQPESNFQEKNPIFLDSSCTTLAKSSSVKHSDMVGKVVEKNQLLMRSKVVKEEKDETLFKKPSLDPKRPSFEECDVKKVSQLMFKSLDSEGVKKGSEVMRGRNSVSSIVPSSVNVGRRRSFCNSQVELADFFSCTGVKVVAVDMPPFMQIHAVDCARKAHDSLEKFTSKTLAHTLKKEFDGVYGPAWHCIVGTSFGSFVTHSVGGFMYFSMDHKIYILLFKTTVQRAE